MRYSLDLREHVKKIFTKLEKRIENNYWS